MGRKKLNKEDKKPHFTLYINETLLDRLDEKTDEKRSQLIEKLLKEYLDKKDVQLGECPKMNNNSTHLALLGITNFYEISSDYIYKLREKSHRPENIFSNLPKYTINTNNQIIEAEYFLQFIGTNKEEETSKYLMFDFETIDSLLSNEISNCGYDNFFEDVDFSKILSKFKPYTEDDLMHFVLPKTNYIVIELEYFSSYYDGGWDTDMNIDIIGYLNNNMELIKFEK